MKVFTVVGNRPQFVKAVPVSAALQEARIDEVVLPTGQHWYHVMSQVFFDQQGKLSQRFGVRAVPTVISQHGDMLLLEEVPAGELR